MLLDQDPLIRFILTLMPLLSYVCLVYVFCLPSNQYDGFACLSVGKVALIG